MAVARAEAEAQLVGALRAGDEEAFADVFDRFTPVMLRLARSYGLSVAAAEDAVQEAWVRVVQSLDGFEERSSLRTWIFAILGNCARRRGERERRSVPVAALGGDPGPTVPEERFFPSDHPRWAGMWSTLVDSWETVPDERLLASETRARLRVAVEELPARQAVVFQLRDVEGWPSEDVCALLDLTPENQRVLLHRARAALRAALEEYVVGQR